jgi:hypothetical protein
MGTVVMGEVGFRNVLLRRWGMGMILFFGLILGWDRFLFVFVFVGCLSFMKINLLQWQVCFLLGLRRGGEAWQWRRRLWAWEEEMLEECRALLLDVSLHVNVSDQWLWIPDPTQGYSVRGAYSVLTSKDLPLVDSAAEMIWHRQVPLKVSVFAWRLLRDRLPTKSNLIYRGVIPPEAGLCVSGCGALESAQHLFLSCSFFALLWPMVRDWIGFVGVDTNVLSEHFVQFVHSTGGSKATKSFFPAYLATLCLGFMD